MKEKKNYYTNNLLCCSGQATAKSDARIRSVIIEYTLRTNVPGHCRRMKYRFCRRNSGFPKPSWQLHTRYTPDLIPRRFPDNNTYISLRKPSPRTDFRLPLSYTRIIAILIRDGRTTRNVVRYRFSSESRLECIFFSRLHIRVVICTIRPVIYPNKMRNVQRLNQHYYQLTIDLMIYQNFQ